MSGTKITPLPTWIKPTPVEKTWNPLEDGVPFNDLRAQYLSIKPEIDAAIARVLEHAFFINGNEVFDFEEHFAAYCGKDAGAVGCSNGTDALTLILRALDIGQDDEVIVPAFSFIATAEAVIAVGATPVYVDITPDTYGIDPQQIEAAITPRTKAIIPVHLYGHPCDMDSITALAKKHHLYVVEDAAQAHGASLKGIRTGLLGDAAAFSFYPGKNLGAYGDAGAVVSRDKALLQTVAEMTNHGRAQQRNLQVSKYNHNRLGYNCRLDTLQAAILEAKLPHLERWTERRRRIAALYTEKLEGLCQTPIEKTNARHVYHLYVIETQQRDDIKNKLKVANIMTGIHYPQGLHQHPSIQEMTGNLNGRFPVAEKLAAQCLSLPIYPEMTDAMAEYVVETLRDILTLQKTLE